MSIAVESRPRGISAFTYPDQTPYLPAEEASTYPMGVDVFENGWEQLINELIDIRFLRDNWDGEGSVAPDPDAVVGAMKLALTFKTIKYPAAERVTASVNGTIYFEWHTSDGYQEIEIKSPVEAELRWVAKDSKTAEIIRLDIP